MARKLTTLILALIILITSCVPADPSVGQQEGPGISEGLDNSEESASESSEEVEWPEDVPHPPEPNPINLSYTVEEGNSANVLIHPEKGGSLSIVDRNNVTYTLVIQPYALMNPEEISMTPLASVEGVPYGEDEAIGVVFEPEGLVFLEPADLSIEMPTGTDLSDSFGYATFADGEDFYLTPWEVDGSTMRLSVSHFSMSALQRVGRAQTFAAEARYSPSNGQAYFENIFAVVNAINPEGGPGVADAAEIHMKTWFYASVLPAMTSALVDTDEIDRAVTEVLRWFHWINDEDGEDPRFDRETSLIWGTLGVAFLNAFAKAEFLCVGGRAPEQALKMIRWLGMIDRLQPTRADGSFTVGNLHGVVNRPLLIVAIESCFKFHLEFVSRILYKPAQVDFTMEQLLYEDLKITFDAERLQIRESNATLPYVTLTVESTPPLPSQCTFEPQPGNVTFKLFVTANLNYLQTAVEDVWLEFIFNKIPQEIFLCGASVVSSHWHANFADLHSLVNDRQRIMVPMLIIRREEAFARFKLLDISSLGASSVTQIDLIHTPGFN